MLTRIAPRTLTLLALAALAACAAPPRPAPGEDPADTATRVFELAAGSPRTTEQLAELFGELRDDRTRAALGDALDALRPAGSPEVTEVVTLEPETRLAIDLRARLDGDAEGFYSVEVGRDASGLWTVRWFQGPGVEWPDRTRGDDGLTTSNPP